MRERLRLIGLGLLLVVTVGTVYSVVKAQAAARLFATLTSNLNSGISTPVTCTQNGNGCYLDVQVAGGGGTFTGPVLLPDGTNGAPSLSFTNNQDRGLFNDTGNSGIGLTVGGVQRALFNVGGLYLNGIVNLPSTGQVGWSSAGYLLANDTTLTRGGAAGKLTLTGTTPMLQLGGTTSSFPALKQLGSGMQIRSADDSGTAVMYGRFGASNMWATDVSPTISSGFGTSPSIPTPNGSSAFTINVGTGGTATAGVIGLATATTGWNCHVTDITAASGHTGLRTYITASTTTTATVESQNSAGAATAWAASSILRVSCFAY